jgi:tRNA pseudouridine38-40 synthase
VVSCRLASSVPPAKMVLALGAHLPDDVSALSAAHAFAGFDARAHAVGKRYVYRVLTRAARDPFDGGTSWHVRSELDLEAMRAAAAHLVGDLDFESFRSAHCEAAHARRYLWRLDVTRQGERLLIDVRGNAFCRNQVRILAGTLVDVGRGRHAPDDVRAMLEARDRTRAGMTAPAGGLTFEEVYYPDTLCDAGIPAGAVFPRYPPTAESWPAGAEASSSWS